MCTKLTVNDEEEYVTLDYESGSGILSAVTPQTVLPSPATHAILTVLKAGESVFQILF